MDRSEFNRQLADAAREMSSESTTQGTLERAVRMATEMVARCDAAGISLVHGETIETPVATSEDLRKVDELQYRIKEGPCFDALRDTETVTSADLASDPRWPEWGARIAGELGFRSTLSFCLFTGGGSLGALSLYSRQPNGFTDDDVVDGHALAAHVAVAFAAAEHADQLTTGLASRALIGQATGILMERFSLDAHTAFGVLVRVSQRTNVRVRHLATHLVETGRIEGLAR